MAVCVLYHLTLYPVGASMSFKSPPFFCSLLAIGGYDGNCRVVSHISWKAFACLEHPTSISSNTVVVFKEQVCR